MTDRLGLYNGALRLIGARKLNALTDSVETRRVLDDIWNNGGVKYCLEQGQWGFATRTKAIDYDPSVTTEFGYQYGFTKPDDYVRTVGIASDPYFNSPLTQYSDEAGYWYSDLETIYVRYVSDDEDYGGDLTLWPETFKRYVEAHFAEQMCERITQSNSKLDAMMKIAKRRLADARSKAALNEPAKFMPTGSWVRARMTQTNYER